MRTDIYSSAAPEHDNEDFAAATSTAAVVLDGAGLSDVDDGGCRHGVAWYVRQLGGALITQLTATDETALSDILAAAIAHVAGSHRHTCDLQHPGTPSATVVMLRTVGEHLQYLVLADSVLVVNLQTNTDVVCDRREADIGRLHRSHMDSVPGGTPAHDAARTEYVATLRRYRNQPEGFWVAAADPDAANHALNGDHELADVTSALLLSDGASRTVDRFDLVTWSQLSDLAAGGSQQVIDAVRAAEQTDLHGSRWPRGKIHDDATAIYCDRL